MEWIYSNHPLWRWWICVAGANVAREKTSVQNDYYDYDYYNDDDNDDDDNNDYDDDNDDQGDSAAEATVDLQLQASERRTFSQVFVASE